MSSLYASAVRKLLTLTLPPLPISPGRFPLFLIAVLIILGLAIAWLPTIETALFLGGALFLVLLLIKPILSLYLLIPLIPFSPLFAVSVGSIKVGLMEIVLASGIVVWLLQRSVGQATPGQGLKAKHQPAKTGRASVLLWPFLLFLAGIGLSWLKALSLGASLVETIKWVEMLVLYLFVVALLPARHVKWVVVVLLLTGMAQALLGLYQFIFKVGPEGFLLFGGRFLRAYGTFAQPNPYAGYLGLVLPLALALTIWGLTDFRVEISDLGWRNRSKIFMLLLLSLPLGLLLIALFASQSRGAWMGFIVAAAVTFTIYNKKTAALMTSMVLAGTIIALVGAFDLNLLRFNTSYDLITQRVVDALSIFTITDVATIEVNDANFAMIERLAHWQAAREMWRDHPWLGVGFGNYPAVYPAYAVGRWLNPLGHAHNYLLNIGAETGLVGITVYLIFWIFTFGVLWLAVQRSHGFDRAVAAGGLGIMVHLHIHNLFDNLYVQGMYLHVAIILALVSVIYRRQTSPNNRTLSQT